MTNYQQQIDTALARISFLARLIRNEGIVEATESTKDLVEYYNEHSTAECEAKLLRLKAELDDIHRDSIATSPFASPTQIEIRLNNRDVRAFLIRVNNPRLVLSQDRIFQIDDIGMIVNEIDLLKIFSPLSNLGDKIM